jgi:hypothetical protein
MIVGCASDPKQTQWKTVCSVDPTQVGFEKCYDIPRETK